MNNARKPRATDLENGKVPPHDVDLEEVLLGAMLLESEALTDVVDILSPDSFYKPEHQKIYEAIIDLFAKQEPIDIITVTSRLKSMGTLAEVGGAYYVSKLTDRVAGSANAEFHARIIEDKAIQRELIRIGADLYHESYCDTSDVLDLLDTVGKQIEHVSGRLAQSGSGSAIDLLKAVVARSEQAAISKGITGLETGITELDTLHGGRQKGHLIIIAARPAMGKTAAALCEALNMAKSGKKVLFVSLEMSAVDLMQRALSVETGIDLKAFQTGQIDSEQWGRINKAIDVIGRSGLTIVDDLHTVNAIRAQARRMKERGGAPDRDGIPTLIGLHAIYIDYIQLINNTMANRNRENEVSDISRSLKLMARAMDIPVIALSQLNRAVETRGGTGRPKLSDLRESGSIEQDADIVEFLYRPEYYGVTEISEEFSTTFGLAFRLIAKNRHGALRDIAMRFHHQCTKFTDWEEPAVIHPARYMLAVSEAVPTRMQPSTSFHEPKEKDLSPF